MARFDVNIAPLEVGNAYCEAKSELKYVQAGLVGVPTIASPTGPFRRAIRHGETGFLATDSEDWERALHGVLESSALRVRCGKSAREHVRGAFGPDTRRRIVVSSLAAVA